MDRLYTVPNRIGGNVCGVIWLLRQTDETDDVRRCFFKFTYTELFFPPFCFKIMHQLGPSFFLHSKRLHYHAPYHGHRGSKPHFYIPFSCRVRILIKLLPLSWVLQAWLHLILLFSDFMPWVNPCATLRLCGVDPSLWTYVNLLVGI